MKDRLRQLLGERRNCSPLEIAAWIVSLLLLTTVVRTNEVLAADSFFFVAHGTSPRVLILLWIAVIVVVLFLLTAVVFASAKFLPPWAFDAVASGLTFLAAAFLLGNAFGWLIGIVAGAVFTLVARRIIFGKVLLVIAAVTAMFPLFTAGATSGNEFAARQVDYGATQNRPSVLWILPDRAQYQMFFDAKGRVRPEFPNLRKLQQTSTTYTRAYSTANGTELSVPSMLNGVAKIPLESEKTQELQRSPGLASWLAPVYDVVVDSPVFTDLCTSSQCSQSRLQDDSATKRLGLFIADVTAVAGNTMNPAIASKFPPLEGRWRGFWQSQPTATQQTAGPQTWVTGLGGGQPPEFVLWHTLATHDPYDRDFEGKTLFDTWLPAEVSTWYNPNGSTPTELSERLNRRLYLAGGVDFDRQLGDVMDRLESEGRLDQTMVIINSDHGRAFTRTGDSRIGDDPTMVWNEVAHVPLLVKYAGQSAPERVTEPRSTAQIAKTILDAAGVAVEDGPALAPDLASPPAEGPYFVVDLGREQPQLEQMPAALPTIDGWKQQDLDAVGADFPLALTDPDLIPGEPLGGGWNQFTPSRLAPVEGDSLLQLLGIRDRAGQCTTDRRAVVTLRGVLVAQVVWDETAQAPEVGTRGWAVLPKADSSEYSFWCS
ncbi:MAG: sulfatase-like hydrolase/transferase [Candidatus Nanopelagicales bacterium]